MLPLIRKTNKGAPSVRRSICDIVASAYSKGGGQGALTPKAVCGIYNWAKAMGVLPGWRTDLPSEFLEP